ncbi:MAG: twin-arginine translocase subunit TatC, partial [Chloroflexi bacterium]|nr:twin-arginine translocase subunit TatC [Chloroflexota bacterium]
MAAPIIKQKKLIKVKPKPGIEDMSVIGHLEEFRTRLIKCVLALAVGTLISAIFTKSFLQFLLIPMGDVKPAALQVTETFVVYFRVALLGGFVLAMPILLYQIVRFILPGLLPSERRILYFMVPGGSFMFALGVAFATLVMLPYTVGYLKGFLSDLVQPFYSIDYYVSFVTTLMFWIGIIFETPLIIFILAKVNLVT